MSYFIYMDNSNVWIEGKRVCAVKRRIPGAANIAEARKLPARSLPRWNLHFGRIRYFAGGNDVAMACLYGSKPPPNDELWNTAKRQGFEINIFDRSFGREKRVDTQMVADLVEHLYTRIDRSKDCVVLIAGDQDHVPALEKAKAQQVRVEVAFWGHCNHHLKDGADEFFNLDPWFDHLTYEKR